MERIVFVMPDKSVQITQPAPRGRREAEDPMTWFKRVADKARPKEAVGDAHIVDTADLPDKHREAWVWNGSKVIIDPSRIKPPKAVREAMQSLPGREIDLTPYFTQLRGEIAAEMGQAFQNMKDDIIRWVIRYMSEINVAINALKSDQEASDPMISAIRGECRQRLSEEGAAMNPSRSWDELAAMIKSSHDADTRSVMGVS